LDRRLGGPQSSSGCSGEGKNSQPLLGIEPKNPNHPAHSPVLYRLSYHGSSTVLGKIIMAKKKNTGWVAITRHNNLAILF
jgi:hypothetical protein